MALVDFWWQFSLSPNALKQEKNMNSNVPFFFNLFLKHICVCMWVSVQPSSKIWKQKSKIWSYFSFNSKSDIKPLVWQRKSFYPWRFFLDLHPSSKETSQASGKMKHWGFLCVNQLFLSETQSAQMKTDLLANYYLLLGTWNVVKDNWIVEAWNLDQAKMLLEN